MARNSNNRSTNNSGDGTDPLDGTNRSPREFGRITRRITHEIAAERQEQRNGIEPNDPRITGR